MLHGIDPNITPELLDCLMRMGHGDELVVADRNFPAASTAADTIWGEVIHMLGFSAPEAVAMITALMPLDGLSDGCAWRMEIDNEPDEISAVHAETLEKVNGVKPENAATGSIERQAFYARSKRAFAVIATSEFRPFGCFILRKGVIF